MVLNYWEIIGLIFEGCFMTFLGFCFCSFCKEVSRKDKKQEQSDPGQESDKNE